MGFVLITELGFCIFCTCLLALCMVGCHHSICKPARLAFCIFCKSLLVGTSRVACSGKTEACCACVPSQQLSQLSCHVRKFAWLTTSNFCHGGCVSSGVLFLVRIE